MTFMFSTISSSTFPLSSSCLLIILCSLELSFENRNSPIEAAINIIKAYMVTIPIIWYKLKIAEIIAKGMVTA